MYQSRVICVQKPIFYVHYILSVHIYEKHPMESTKNELVVKSNKLIEASYKLELAEQRLILLAIVEARKNGSIFNSEESIDVKAQDFAHLFGVTYQTAYEQLYKAAKTLFRRYIVIHDIHPQTGKARETEARWVSSASYIEGIGLIQIRFSSVVIPFITRLEKEFTSYKIGSVSKMTSTYAIRLYELLLQWERRGSRNIEINWLKNRLQVQSEYKLLAEFKRRVIDIAVDQINEHSDLTVSYTQRKSGRTVTHLIFKFEPKPIEKLAAPTPKASTLKLSKKEIERLARVGESYAEAEERILEERRKATI